MILYLGNKLSEHGHTPTSVETLGERLREIDEVKTASRKKNKILRILDMLFAIYKNKNHKPIVLLDTYSTSAFNFAYYSGVLCSLLKLKYICILRGGALEERIKFSKKKCDRLFRNSFVNVAVSDFMAEIFRKYGYNVIVIPNYIDLKYYPFKLRENISLKLLWVRSFHRIYNPEMAVEILHQLKSAGHQAELTMTGPDKDGSLNNCKTLAAKYNLKVNFTGRLTKKEWADLSAKHDVFVNTTDVDNTPVSVMEAMALGMPVVTTNAGGIPYLFENGKEGIMVAPRNAEIFTAAIIKLADDPVLVRSLSESARARAAGWDWEIVKQYWKALIDSAQLTDINVAS